MAVRADQKAWTSAEVKRLAVLSAQGMSPHLVARTLNAEFHSGDTIRTTSAVQLKRTKCGIKVGPRQRNVTAVPETEQTVERSVSQKGIEARANGSRIKTVEDLLRHIDADMTRFEVSESQATKYEVATKDISTGKVTTTELHRVYVKLRPKQGPSTLDAVTALIDGAFAKRKPVVPRKPAPAAKSDVLQAVVLADPHIGKYAWSRETGWEDYDTSIATRLIRASVAELLETDIPVGRRALWCLGDILHYDTPHGTTTSGTPLDRDGRVEKMLEEAVSVLCDCIEAMAERSAVDVVLVPGNHDAVMTVALRQILTAYFERHARVTINSGATTRKYVTHGRCLIGLAHGDKAQKRLGELMALEANEAWGRARLREVHHGHYHSEAAITTVGGVTVRQHPALCPADGWHAAEGFVGAPRAMDAYYYHADGYLVGMRRANIGR